MKTFKGCLGLGLLLALTGCVSSDLEISEKDILEVARDDANATKANAKMFPFKKKKSL